MTVPGSSGPPGSSSSPGTMTGPGGSSGVADGCDGLVGEGFAVGDIAENWTLQDGNGNDVNLHDYCGKVVFLEIGSEW